MLLIVGAVAGVLAGLLGIGGGLVIVPALVVLLGRYSLPADALMAVAVASALASMLLTSASAIGFHLRRRAIDPQVIARLAPAVTLGALGGAWLATWLDGVVLSRVFAVVAALIGLRMLLARPRSAPDREPAPRAWWLAGPLIGAVSAMIGIGGGSFNVPYLIYNGYSTVRAVAMASTCGWLIGLGGTITFLITAPPAGDTPWLIGYVHWPAALLIGLGGAASAPLGVALAHRLPARRLARIFGIVLILVALRMGLVG
ncbi:sulfite exporter TauE/SafE family protein [Wenzhouxiangella marina]|uniref:Probable membrane transporter protein n=1 Tax=Wenzhouxiangella marina TaxID=1579979 RepID=A0A0K0XZ59_9GAMM|nr:sulfite exporter TauE/SafE family protein [Wenzhouxiangella marina]AKS42917.1 hypothetical protein WM2015_2559 [Wenzhouxiangella marina]MBB6087400.1 hypothetical protein [Wenzhouxiangella marina]